MKFTAIVSLVLASVANAQTPEPSAKPSLAPSGQPSDAPSLKPSAAPSLKPSAAPSDAPSLKPSVSPSDAPSLKPSAAPSLKPSAQPSDAPSLKPSVSPSDVPSLEPSTSPSMAPSLSGMPSSLPSAPPTKPMPQIEIDFDGFCMNLVNATLPISHYTSFYSLFGECIEETIVELMAPVLTTPGQRILSLSVTEVDGNAVTRRLEQAPEQQQRKLADVLTEVKYNIKFEQFCTRGNCDDATTLTATVLDFLTTKTDAALEDGSFLTSVEAKAVTKGIDGSHLVIAAMKPGDCTPTTVVNSILPMLWYPDWAGTNTGCIMDGNEDEYMRLNPEGYYLFEYLEDCCARHYSWDYNTCAGIATTAVGPDGNALYYPDWEGENKSCKNDGAQPTYMSNNVDAWMFADLETCCTARYSWNLDECMGASATAAVGTNKWFVDYENSKCVQDCVGAAPCGGLAEAWDTTFDDAAACCAGKLGWLKDTACEAASTGIAAATAATSMYYVDWTTETCVVDSGSAESWDTLYESKAQCCQRLGWKSDCLTA